MTFGELTNILLFEKTNYKAIYDCLHALHAFYSGITGISADQTTDNNIFLPTGKAISPGQAANCLLDIKRTTVFMRGIHKAILQLKKDFAGPINIFYAGCGPYATLVTHLTAVFSPQEVRFYLMDINRESLSSVEKLYAQLGALEYIEELICENSATYKLEKTMHLGITETMQQALLKEPQVSIMLNLIPQLPEKGVFIPQRVQVTAKLIDRNKEMEGRLSGTGPAERLHLGTAYSIGMQNCNLPVPVTFEIPLQTGSLTELFLFTEIVVFEDERLEENDCSITLPYRLGDMEGEKGKTVWVEYVINERPGWRWELEG